MTISKQNDIVEKYFTKGRSKQHLSVYTTSGDGLDIHRFSDTITETLVDGREMFSLKMISKFHVKHFQLFKCC